MEISGDDFGRNWHQILKVCRLIKIDVKMEPRKRQSTTNLMSTALALAEQVHLYPGAVIYLHGKKLNSFPRQ